MTIKTSTGNQFDCDLAVTSDNPPRLYVNIINESIATVAAEITNPAALPLIGYPNYRTFSGLNITPYGTVNVCLAP